MIAARRRRAGSLSERLHRRSRQLDRIGNRGLERAYPTVRAATRRGERAGRQAWGWLWPRLRPLLGLFFRAVAALERWVRRSCSLLVRVATAASAVITPGRAAAVLLIAAGACLVASQFIDYRAVEIGQPGYTGLGDVAAAASHTRSPCNETSPRLNLSGYSHSAWERFFMSIHGTCRQSIS
jgi:hypothetical protein